MNTTLIVVYCPRCDYFKKVAVQVVGTHGCAQCDGLMEVYVAQEFSTTRPASRPFPDTTREDMALARDRAHKLLLAGRTDPVLRGWCHDLEEALGRVAAELERLERERNEAEEAMQSLAANHYFARAEEAEDEVARLRDGLRRLDKANREGDTIKANSILRALLSASQDTEFGTPAAENANVPNPASQGREETA